MEVEIFVDQEKIDARVAEIEGKTSSLQSVYTDLKTLGVTEPTLSDIKTLQGNHASEDALKALVLRDKTLTVGGVTLGAGAVQLNQGLVSSLKAKLKALRDIDYKFYELVESLDEEEEPTGEYEVAVVEDLEEILTPGYTITGSELTAEIVEDAGALATLFNAILDKLDPGVQSPLRDPEQYLKYNSVTRRFSVDYANIVRLVK